MLSKDELLHRGFFELGQAKQIITFLISDHANTILSCDRQLAQEWLDTYHDRIYDRKEQENATT